jgi:hypothetical protein
MTIQELYVYFGSLNKAANAIGVPRGNCYNWLKRGYIPLKKQRKIEEITKGVLKLRKSDIKKAHQDEEDTLLYFPNFRYYDETDERIYPVESILFREGQPPKITYLKSNKREKYSAFNTNNLMQSTEIMDDKGELLFEKDIILFESGEKFIFKDLSLLNKVKKAKGFSIIGNVLEGEKNNVKNA